MLKTQRFDFIVSDINMPEMDGFQLLQAIRAEPSLRHPPVLMVTAEARKEDIVRARRPAPRATWSSPSARARCRTRCSASAEDRHRRVRVSGTAALLKTIPVDQLRLGMHLHSVGGRWLDHPFWTSCPAA